jgi:hypothetical protein
MFSTFCKIIYQPINTSEYLGYLLVCVDLFCEDLIEIISRGFFDR